MGIKHSKLAMGFNQLLRKWFSKTADIASVAISRPVGMISSILILSLIIAELSSPTFRKVSGAYPLTRTIIAGFVTLAFTVNVINQILTRRIQKRWERVCGIAMQGLNDELRISRDLLYIVQNGSVPFDATLPVVVDAKKRIPPPVSDIMARFNLPDQGDALIKLLVDTPEWVLFARDSLAEVSAYLRGSLARWAPLLSIGAEVSSSTRSVILNTAYIVDAISMLEVPLAQIRLDNGVVPPRVRIHFMTLLEMVSAAFVFVEETSANALRPSFGHPPTVAWKSAMRNMLTPKASTHLDKWSRNMNAVMQFQKDLSKAKFDLDQYQVDAIYLYSPPKTTP